MPAVYGKQCGVVEGLYSEFNKYRTRSVDVAEQFHSLRRQCVGARSHGKPNHSLHRQRLVVKPPELSGRSPVCICIRLEIGNIPHVGILSAKKLLASLKLRRYPLCPEAIGRSEGTVVAVDASAGTDCAVTVGTAETGIHRNLLYLYAREHPGHIFRIVSIKIIHIIL
jgi:hypothetical protein